MQSSRRTDTNRPLENNEAFAIFILGITVFISLMLISVKVLFG
ncbi:MAG: hypothetical protein AAFO04_14835 [Cyanobacteria bacterium J06592_8]